MAKDESIKAAGQSGSVANDPMAAARAARKKGGGNGRMLSIEERYSVQNVRLAAKACKLVLGRISEGKPVPPKVLEACATLSGSLSDMLYS